MTLCAQLTHHRKQLLTNFFCLYAQVVFKNIFWQLRNTVARIRSICSKSGSKITQTKRVIENLNLKHPGDNYMAYANFCSVLWSSSG